jgi:hypothetical protein
MLEIPEGITISKPEGKYNSKTGRCKRQEGVDIQTIHASSNSFFEFIFLSFD